jgi:drug/metabolite transporter (DMT)-like permease
MPKPQPALLSGNILGIVFMLMAVSAGVITSVIIKSLSPIATLLVLLSLRFLFSIPFLTASAYIKRGAQFLQVTRWDRLLMRILAGHISIIFWFLAVSHATLGQATALFQSSAIFVTILSPLILKEKVGIYRGSAVFLGLLGIIMITNPFQGDFNIGTIYGLISALAGAILVVLLRLLGRTEEPVTVALWHNLVGAIGYPILMIYLSDVAMFNGIIASSFLLMIIFGIAASFVQIGFTSAYRHGEAAVLAPIRYLSVPAAALIGFLIWNESLALMEILGMMIVVSACVFISWREYKLSRHPKPIHPEPQAE